MATRKGSDNRFPLIRLVEAAEDDDPTPTGELHIRADEATKLPYVVDDAGLVTPLGGGSGGGPGTILQVVTATDTGSTATTSTTYQDTPLDVTITPMAADSLLIVDVHAWFECYRVSGSPANRQMYARIRNSTDNVNGDDHLMGPELEGGASSAAATQRMGAVALRFLYTVNSLTPRTFLLQIKSQVATDIEAAYRGDASDGFITITEVAQ